MKETIQLTFAQFEQVLAQLPKPTLKMAQQHRDYVIAVMPDVATTVSRNKEPKTEQVSLFVQQPIMVRFFLDAHNYQYPKWVPTQVIIIDNETE